MRGDKRKNFDLMAMGKVPPQSKDLEAAILGGIMLERTAFAKVYEILKHFNFYVDAHQKVFKACESLNKKSQPIDELTVAEELKRTEELEIVGGVYFLSQLTAKVVSTAGIERYARIILQKFVSRELIRVSGEIIGEAYEDSTDALDLLSDAGVKIKDI